MDKIRSKYMKMKFVDLDDKRKKIIRLSMIKDNIDRLEVTVDKIGEDLKTVIQSVSNKDITKNENNNNNNGGLSNEK